MAGKRKRKAPEKGTGRTAQAVKKAKSQTSEDSEGKRHDALNTVRRAVFNTTELLEAIIVRLPIHEILTIQRVCRRFNDIIQESVQIQQKLFFRLRGRDPQQKDWIVRRVGHEELFRQDEPGYNSDDSEPDWSDEEFEFVLAEGDAQVRYDFMRVHPAKFCPLVRRYFPAYKSASERLAQLEVEDFIFDIARLVERPGSWKKAQLTDPPCKRITFGAQFRIDTQNEIFECDTTVRDIGDEGITLGEIAAAVMAAQVIRASSTLTAVGPTEPWKTTSSISEILESSPTHSGGGKAQICYLDVHASFDGIVTPSDEEFEEVIRKAKEREADSEGLRRGTGGAEENA